MNLWLIIADIHTTAVVKLKPENRSYTHSFNFTTAQVVCITVLVNLHLFCCQG